MNKVAALLLILGSLIMSSCSSCDNQAHEEFKARDDYRSTKDVYFNKEAYDKTPPGETRVYIDLSDQRAQLLAIKDITVLIDTPVSTGRYGKSTPTGRYPVQEKLVNKRSTLFGKYYYRGRVVYSGDRRRYRGRRSYFVGASLPYWMRMNNSGIGMHGSNSIRRYPSSNGCVRTPQDVIPKIFAKVEEGTTVVVVP